MMAGMPDGPAVPPDDRPDAPTDDRAAEGLAHLQTAARELIQAARAMLDIAEELVEDPGTVGVVADAVGNVVRTAARAGRRAAGMAGDDRAGDAEDPAPSGVERIRIG
jgi:hypothetical protein